MARTGRRPGESRTREAILEAARAEFAARGYDGASLRAVARAAGVDPALVHHYFGGKRDLFGAAMRLPANPVAVVEEALAGPAPERGERLVLAVLALWDGPGSEALLSLFRSGLGSDRGAAMLREFFAREVLPRIVAALDDGDAELRAALAVSQIGGLVVARHVLRLPPLADASHDALAASVGPTLQRYLDGELIT